MNQMPVITQIKPQKRKNRVNIYLDGKFGFGLNLETFIKNNLKVEQEISDEDIKKLVKEGEFQSTFEKLVKYATLRPRSKNEVQRWFGKHRVHKSLREDLIAKLEKLELVHDKKFARWWVEQRLTFKPRGKYALMQELRKKGVDKKTISKVLSEIEVDETEQAVKLLERKKYRWERVDKIKARKKMSDFLARKGYDWQTIREAVDIVSKNR
jgi:regulatory protein